MQLRLFSHITVTVILNLIRILSFINQHNNQKHQLVKNSLTGIDSINSI